MPGHVRSDLEYHSAPLTVPTGAGNISLMMLGVGKLRAWMRSQCTPLCLGIVRMETKFAIWWLEASAGTAVERMLKEGDEEDEGSPMLTHPCQLAESPVIPSAKTTPNPFNPALNCVTAILATIDPCPSKKPHKSILLRQTRTFITAKRAAGRLNS